jgi:hypothetical protein
MAKRLGGVLLRFGVNTAGEFCISYDVRLGEMCIFTLTVVLWCRARGVRVSPTPGSLISAVAPPCISSYPLVQPCTVGSVCTVHRAPP